MELLQGDPIPLSHQAHDGDEGLFVEAIILDANKVELPSSPVDLTHEKAGKYIDDSVSMPNSKYLYVTYRAYIDAGKTIVSEIHGDGTDRFKLRVDEVRRFLTSDTVLEGELESNIEIAGDLEKTPEIVGELDSQSIVGEIEADEELEGELSSSDIKGSLDDCE